MQKHRRGNLGRKNILNVLCDSGRHNIYADKKGFVVTQVLIPGVIRIEKNLYSYSSFGGLSNNS